MTILPGMELWRLGEGWGAGALGTLALTAWEPVRGALLGHEPVYSVGQLAKRGARQWWGVRLSDKAANRWGLLARWMYGPSLGALYAWARPVLPRRLRWSGVLLGCAVGAFEALSFAPLRVTASPRTWSRGEHALLAFQVLLFGFVTEAVLARTEKRNARPRRR